MHWHIYKDAAEATIALADWMVSLIQKTLEVKDRFIIALSGGETPKRLYQTLAADSYHEKIKWDRIHIFWGDERVVPFNDEQNNAKMAYDNLLSKVNIPPGNIHKIWTDMIPEQSAAQYEKLLHQYFDDKQTTFDLTLLGMGEDGHTLSLFPGSENLEDNTSWVAAAHSKEKGERITLLPAIVNSSAAIAFLVTGEKKATVLQEVIEDPSSKKYPAQLIQPVNGELHWFVDAAAASKIR